MLRALFVDRIVDMLARVAIVACFIAIWGAVLGVSVRHSVVKRIGFQAGSPSASQESSLPASA
jgi:hypothetical protein